ncbi:UDP-N-acetylmuramoyl-L-alanyl-D-glutamate--2,6-diaminopimelate ligase [Aquincola sp. S2]|uniref:UDP-N-acetylmuramoyl-L-alanyl-D-glutamate--2,6-diaminopimelate ligase n=1 Tax=Pseudaquabacterium terrae TaxID=2732868 RepID=A0ABX2ERZ3_9BURK|nr:UDP-N-acetylmuramoyl-L-alanyl-D-glutamate--2,6-diaminopimelate ligase [Aquabacterium terrae]NRF71522.1 UDP-N-acetylmuramoyl-L-alanyl-D-glutamate--2,6-diaminopimelate ligase [Aquabacterium terrae]
MLTRLKSPEAAARWLSEWVTGTLRTDSRQVRPGDAFIAWPGYATDGRKFVRAALDAGAATCLVEDEGIAAFGFDTDGHEGFIHGNARIGTLPKLKAATGPIAAAYFGRPTEALQVVAVTGTNGKSSTAWWTAQALSLLGQRCGVVGTLGIGQPPLPAGGVLGGAMPAAGSVGSVQFTGLTTPDPVMLQAAFRRMADEAYAACAIEASSIGIAEHRLAGTRIRVAQFTNFTRDHLDYHGDMAAYWATKRALFAWAELEAAVVNIDDAQGAALAAELQGGTLDLWTLSTTGPARLAAQNVRYVDGGLAFELTEAGTSVPVRSTLIGDYNAHNLLGVIGALRSRGITLQDAVRIVPALTPVPGRMQRVALAAAGVPELVVDYAHTPDALEKAIAALRPLAEARGGRLWCAFGCGGNRDATKRPLMGGIARRLADRVIVTSDNPRHEDPAQILAQIVAGIADQTGIEVIEDRRAAIDHAVAEADARDVVLIAGKGHEDYQEIAGIKHAFSDVEVAAAALLARSGS